MSGTQSLIKAFTVCALAMLTVAPQAFAVSSGDDFVPGRSYLTVSENSQDKPALFAAYQEAFGSLAVTAPNTDRTMINVLQWTRNLVAPPRPREAYNRQNHFGTWIDPQSDRTCFNVRGLVLIRDSLRPITTVPTDPCFVATGQWNEPYTGRVVTQAKDLQIDHVVPLKNAYISGAFAWDWKTRCAYGNYMGNKFHLLPVDSTANMAKGDNTPVNFLPPNRNFTCEYLADWLKIKMIWRLMMSEQEGIVISKLIQSYHCDARLFQYPVRDLASQRQAVTLTRNECPNTAAETLYQPGKR